MSSKLKEDFGGTRLNKIHPFHFEKYKKRRAKDGATVALNRELQTLKAMFNRLGMGKGGLKKFDGPKPVTQIDFLEESKGKLRFLEDEEEERLVAEAGEPLATAIQLALHTGVRINSEGVSSLRCGAVDLERGLLHVASASGKERSIRLNAEDSGTTGRAYRTAREVWP